MLQHNGTYDAASRIGSMDSYVDGLTSFTHDNTDQLKTADHTGQTDESYSYDENGNRTMSGYATTDNNQLTTDGVYNCTYDDEGNRLTKTKISTGEKEEYTWDHRNRLTKITFKNSGGTVLKTVDQTYDVFNQWIRRSVDADGPGSGTAVDTFFSHEGGQVAIQFAGSAATNLSHRYLWGPAVDQLLADELVTSLTTPGAVQYPLGDHLATLQDLATYDTVTNTTTIANHRRYDSYGNLTSETNAAVDELFGFTGRAFDESTGQQNNLNRWYDSRAGNWLSEDMIGFNAGDANLQRYVGNTPTMYIDPSGLSDHTPGLPFVDPTTGKIHGDIPDGVPKNWCPDKIKDAIDDAEHSLKQRLKEQAEKFGTKSRAQDWGHQIQIRKEMDWLRKLKGALPRLPSQ